MAKAEDDTPEILSNPDVGLPAGEREWLVTNGLGGYAAGTVRGVATRRYHGLLISAHAPPDGRRMLLNHLVESLHLPDDRTVYLDTDQRLDRSPAADGSATPEFRLDYGLPVWLYRFGAVAAGARQVLMVRERNITLVRYRLTEGGPLRFGVRPLIHFRRQHAAVGKFEGEPPYKITETAQGHEIVNPGQPHRLRLRLVGARPEFRHDPRVEHEVLYRKEAERLPRRRRTLVAGGVRIRTAGRAGPITLIASDEDWDEVAAVRPEDVLQAEIGRAKCC